MTLRVLLVLVVCAGLPLPRADAAVLRLLHSMIRNNLAGTADNFKTQPWPFDPAVGEHWSKEYQQLNGIRGEELIERTGLGEDTHTEERRAQQAFRDRGVYVSRQPLHGP